MDKNEIFEFVIREMTETVLLNRRVTAAAGDIGKAAAGGLSGAGGLLCEN